MTSWWATKDEVQEIVIKNHISSRSFSDFSVCLTKCEPLSAEPVNLKRRTGGCDLKGHSFRYYYYLDNPAEELTALVQPNPWQEFLSVFLEMKNLLSPHFGDSPGWCNSSLGLSLLCYKLNWTQSLTLGRGQTSHTGRAAEHMKNGGLWDVLWLLSSRSGEHTRPTSPPRPAHCVPTAARAADHTQKRKRKRQLHGADKNYAIQPPNLSTQG